ncbi:type 1 glutamine amidotransferase [Pseudomonas sp.]|uniref:type 1 glutamine amidotransferase n=1 Tax=Pseudomonas sp. TaxID=306 RepID=UPI00261C6719|nr:type 1 glutamine amidotransferase [Pseudomonas sp.]
MRVHVFKHAPFEGIGHIQRLLSSWGNSVQHTCFYEPDPQLPALHDVDLLIVMGGPMSVNDEQKLPWLIAEKRFIRKTIDAGIPVLGICLGAQLIANALGAAVGSNDCAEIGWFPVESVDTPQHFDSFRMPSEITAMHWHGETFQIPKGAVRLARSEACANQAFQFGRRTIALQFHPEITKEIVEELLVDSGDELEPGPYVQSALELASAPEAAYAPGHRLIESILEYLVAS